MYRHIQPWILAARPKTLTAAFVPVYIATMLAWDNGAVINWSLSVYALLAAIFVQIGTNLINDALDYKKGADTKKRLGPVRAAQSGLISIERVLVGGMMCFALALLFGIPLMTAGGLPLTLILFISVLCGYLYTGGPYPLAYSGLGDLFVLIFFGLVATCSVYFLQMRSITLQAFVAGAQAGLLATVLIAVNNIRDVEGDALANKKTIPVRFGIYFAKMEVTILILCNVLLSFFWMAHRQWWAALLPFLTLPVVVQLLQGIWTHPPGRIYNNFLGKAAFLHLSYGTLIGIGLLIK